MEWAERQSRYIQLLLSPAMYSWRPETFQKNLSSIIEIKVTAHWDL